MSTPVASILQTTLEDTPPGSVAHSGPTTFIKAEHDGAWHNPDLHLAVSSADLAARSGTRLVWRPDTGPVGADAATTLRQFAQFIVRPVHEGLDAWTLIAVAHEAEAHAERISYAVAHGIGCPPLGAEEHPQERDAQVTRG